MTTFVFALLGGMVGLAVLQEFGGFVLGAALGALAGRIGDLTSRVRLLERRLDAQRAAEARAAASDARAAPEAAAQPAAAGAVSAGALATESPVPLPTSAPMPAPAPEPPADLAAAREATPEPAAEHSRAAAQGPKPSLAELARARRTQALASGARAATNGAGGSDDSGGLGALVETMFRWFTTGNVPVKVGVVLSVFGVGFLVKEGIDRHWLVLPLEFRLALVAAFGVVLLAVGWRLRRSKPAYALSVQGGGIAVLYLTIYASYALYSLLPGVAAFGALVLVTAAAGVLAVLQDSRALAVLGIVGGFMAPVLTSSGSGDHVALFSYYAVLNVAILAIAWFKSWRSLNVLGFAFTFGIATLWGADGYTPEKFATTEPFLVIFVLFYLAIPVLFATRQPPELRGFVDGTLVFGTPIVGFALQSRLVANTEYGLALSAVALAAVYVLLATFLYRRRRDELRVLVEAQLALAVAFVTVAIPLALDARWTSAAWALQGAALVWLGFRQRRRLALVAGLGLQALSGWQYFEQPPVAADWPVVNGLCLGALLLALAGALSARWFDPERARPESDLDVREGLATFMSIGLLLWALGWWLYAGFTEIDREVTERYELGAVLLFVAATAWLVLGVAAKWHWRRIASVALLPWPVAIFGAAIAPISIAHPAEALGWLAWPATLATMLGVLRLREAQWPRLAALLHAAAYWLAAALLVWEARWHVGNVANGVWPDATTLVVGALLVSLTLRARERIAWPLAAHADVYVRVACGGVVAVLLLGAVTANVASSGDAAPLPYLPLVNPLELASVLVLLVALRWSSVLEAEGHASLPSGARGIGAALFVWLVVTMAVARAVHHFAGVPFDADSLAASTTFQAALSIVWGIAGLSAMLVGTRSARRLVWLAGAGLMAVVVVKLFLVDLGNTGTLARVVSFLGVGLLLLVVGYFAPVPPRLAAAGVQPGSHA